MKKLNVAIIGQGRSGKNIHGAFLHKEENVWFDVKYIVDESEKRREIAKTEWPNATILASHTELYGKKDMEKTLARVLSGIKESGEYDFILIDSPPTLGMLVMNVMCAADFLLIPIEASPWGLFGLANMLDFFAKAKEQNPALSLLGIAVTKADERKTYFRQTMEFLAETPGVNVFKNYVRIDSAVEWAQDNSQPVAAYKKSSRSAKEYTEMTKEMLEYVDR